jgi:hypothetical protein
VNVLWPLLLVSSSSFTKFPTVSKNSSHVHGPRLELTYWLVYFPNLVRLHRDRLGRNNVWLSPRLHPQSVAEQASDNRKGSR